MTRALSASLGAILLLAGCGGSGSLRDSAGQAAAIAAEVAAAAAIAVLTHRGRHRTEDGYEEDQREGEREPVHAPPLEDVGDTEPQPRQRMRPLPLWQVPYAMEIEAEDLWCDNDADCVRVQSVDGCAPDQGGVELAVSRSSADRLRAELADAEPSHACPGDEDASHSATPHCLDNLCRLVPIDDLGDVPPPPSQPAADGLAPVPPPP